MNPNYPVAVSCLGGTIEKQEPKNLAEKIGIRLQSMSSQNEASRIEQNMWRIEREGAEAIRMLCEEIDNLKKEIDALKS